MKNSTDMEINNLLEQYESLFEDLPPLPKMGNYGTIADLIEDAVLRKQPLTMDEVMEAFKESDYPLDQGNEDYPEE